MRRAAPFALLLALAGCGAEQREPPRAPVRLEVAAPADLARVSDETVEVRGTVAPPDARVLVAGDEADVSGGEFTLTVALESGANVIDVQAAAPRRAAAMTALRVVRIVPVEIPELEGRPTEDAVAALEALGLEVKLSDAGAVLDDFFFGEEGVCATQPESGTEVLVGSTVIVAVAGACAD